MFVLKLAIVALLACIVYEDFRFRWVRVIYYLLVLILLAVFRTNNMIVDTLLVYAGFNLLYLIVLFGLAYLYFYFKNGIVINTRNYIGAGDLIFLLAMAIWFDPFAFIIFNTISLWAAMIFHMILKRFSRSYQSELVPLAGMQSVCFLFVFLFNW